MHLAAMENLAQVDSEAALAAAVEEVATALVADHQAVAVLAAVGNLPNKS